jgi:quercetin dioxygenase-like cupin family protein
MRVIDFSPEHARPIALYESNGASSVNLANGTGEAHVYCVHFEPRGKIGRHPTGFGQLFLVIRGEGWAEGAGGERVSLQAGQGVVFERGELHAKGSDTGMSALMVQIHTFTSAAELEP